MTMFVNGLFIVLLAVLAPSLGSQPGPDELPDKLAGILTQLENAKAEFQSIFDVTNEQCPCQTPGDCFESDLEALNSTLCDLINNLTALIGDQSTDCPALEGCAALVSGFDSSDIAVVDPVGTILPNIEANRTVGPLTVVGANNSDYSIYYGSNGAFFTVNQLSLPSEDETVEYTFSTSATRVKGIAYLDDKIFVALENFIGFINDIARISGGSVTHLRSVPCPGTVRSYDGRVYFSSCKEIQSFRPTAVADLETNVKFSMNMRSFDVIDQDNTVFCDDTGALWIYNDVTACFKLLDCSVQCRDVKVNRCSSLVYVASSSVSHLSIFNSTSYENEGTLTYTTSTASAQPRLEFEPSCP
ncbi:uncharacterized protein LOC124148898 [Haliotis rufescens]|uniref:uncharacterized protein LOC124148898 n=1 Tax=Haliotis rufescens TaxID=6454 RepID=UPI00201F652B|nr:uncharacterized protein LOC124148898 [Haliotis rufescens]